MGGRGIDKIIKPLLWRMAAKKKYSFLNVHWKDRYPVCQYTQANSDREAMFYCVVQHSSASSRSQWENPFSEFIIVSKSCFHMSEVMRERNQLKKNEI